MTIRFNELPGGVYEDATNRYDIRREINEIKESLGLSKAYSTLQITTPRSNNTWLEVADMLEQLEAIKQDTKYEKAIYHAIMTLTVRNCAEDIDTALRLVGSQLNMDEKYNDEYKIFVRELVIGNTATYTRIVKHSNQFNLFNFKVNKTLSSTISADNYPALLLEKDNKYIIVRSDKQQLNLKGTFAFYYYLLNKPIVADKILITKEFIGLCIAGTLGEVNNLIAGKIKDIEAQLNKIKIKNMIKNIKETRLEKYKDKYERELRQLESCEYAFNQALTNVSRAYKELEAVTNLEDTDTEEMAQIEEMLEFCEVAKPIKNVQLEVRDECPMLVLDIVAPLNIFDTTAATNYGKHNTELSLKKVFEAVYIKRKFDYYVQNKITVNLVSGAVESTYSRQQALLQNPHLGHYNCWGNHKGQLIELAKAKDYIGLAQKIIYIVSNMNFFDSAVTSKLLRDDWCTHVNACMFKPNGAEETANYISFRDIVAILESEEKEEEDMGEEI